MNTLWIFGDSFSIEYVDNLHENHKRYVQLKNINEITTWPKFLGDKLNYQVKNLAKGGNSNYEIFQNSISVRDRTIV